MKILSVFVVCVEVSCKMKVYNDMKGSYILIRKPKEWEAGTEFMVLERENTIQLVKIKK